MGEYILFEVPRNPPTAKSRWKICHGSSEKYPLWTAAIQESQELNLQPWKAQAPISLAVRKPGPHYAPFSWWT